MEYLKFIREDIIGMLETAYNISSSLKEEKDKLEDLLDTINKSWGMLVFNEVNAGSPDRIKKHIDRLEKLTSDPINFNVNGELLPDSHQVRIINYGKGYAIEYIKHYISAQGYPIDETKIQKSFDSLYDAKVAYVNYMVKGLIKVVDGKLRWALS
jgi:hypothetical protein